jgi:hypothetical protein
MLLCGSYLYNVCLVESCRRIFLKFVVGNRRKFLGLHDIQFTNLFIVNNFNGIMHGYIGDVNKLCNEKGT